ncbi:DUF6114 domain-containing protein [Actinoplanes couchii]|uniref:Uncharacterized protein n=1 Tax=Actinoplanes couchii TaxID=403638 RepID=A0ABQ3XGP5_9ACTN|nr:DUF6114 domain-containing protein [Actinoplanes couchii]MDR6321074.1 hypothetical protein [Actinoplanes couchii]GID57585.1 hypothetical protein Aco03nite_059890 [Actinoplanes couchii]
MTDVRARFRRWRRGRPFWGGLFLLLAGLEMFGSANMELDDIQIHIGPQGFYSYLLPVMLIAAGVLTWYSPAQRLFYGVVGIITALYSFIGLNLGGWIAGMLLGIIGGALAIAWGPPATKTGDSTAPLRKALIILAPLLLATGVIVAGNRPAEAAECPAGLPSRKPSASPSSSSASPKPPTTDKPTTDPVPSTSGSASAEPSPSPSASDVSPSVSESAGGNPILEGIDDFWDGVGDLIGIGGGDEKEEGGNEKEDRETPAGKPSTSAAPSPQPPAATPDPEKTPSASPSPSRSKKAEEIPCLGERQLGLLADDDGLPRAGAKPGIVKADSMTMYESSYDGVAEVPTGDGPIRSLKFSMDKVVNKPFQLTIDEPGDATTVIDSGELILDGAVEFYTPRFEGKLFGLIPVVFTPESPPPLTLPVLWFTDVTVDLAYVRSDVLTAEPLDIVEK